MTTNVDTADLEWLVTNRARVQQLLLRIYRLAPPRADEPGQDDAVFQLLVGAGFSLWRSVFLADGTRSAGSIADHAKAFLETLIRDNAINYPLESRTRAWTVGYFINNAVARLSTVYKKLALSTNLSGQLDHFVGPQTVPGPGALRAGPQPSWEMACAAAEEILEALESRKGAHA